MFKAIFFLWFFLLSGCAVHVEPQFPPPTAPVVTMHADSAFTADERTVIYAASKVWMDQTSGQAQISFLWDLDFNSASVLKEAVDKKWTVLVRMTEDLEEVQDMDCEAAEAQGLPCNLPKGWGPQVLAWVSPAGGIHNLSHQQVIMKVVVDRANTPADLKQTVVHEFGHVFGLPHSPVPQAIMYPAHRRRDNVCLTPADLALFCSVNVCTKPTIPCEPNG